MIQRSKLLAIRGRPEEALGWMDAAMRLNPLHPTWYYSQLGIVLYSLRRYAEAAQGLKRLPNPGHWSRAWLAACYAQLGQMSETKAEVAAILREWPNFSTADFLRRDILLERVEDRELLREGLIKAGLPK
jgi:adenylate cyclase